MGMCPRGSDLIPYCPAAGPLETHVEQRFAGPEGPVSIFALSDACRGPQALL